MRNDRQNAVTVNTVMISFMSLDTLRCYSYAIHPQCSATDSQRSLGNGHHGNDHRAGSMTTAVGNRSFSNRWERTWRWSTISAGSLRTDCGTYSTKHHTACHIVTWLSVTKPKVKFQF